MGLSNKLETEGSKFTYTANGAVATPYPDSFIPDTNQLATQNSILHGTLAGGEGYSLAGAGAGFVNALFNQYKDGVPPSLPNPSELDLNGQLPSKYVDNAPDGALGI